jgi:hypothetical protein
MAILLHLVVTPMLSIKTARAMPTQEKPSALVQYIVMRIVASSVEVSAFAAAVKIDTTTT